MKISPLQWVAIGGLVLIGLLGGGGIFYLSGQLGQAQDTIAAKASALGKLTGDRYYPSQANIDVLTKSNDALSQALDLLKQKLLAPGNKLGQVGEKNPVVFKQELAEQIRSLADLAAKNGVRVDPGASYFGFSVYQNNNPSDKGTRILGKQLLGIGEVASALFNAKVSSLDAVRRTFDENPGAVPPPPTGGGGGGPGGATESLRGKIVTPEGGLYSVYPLEVEFTGSEESLRNFLTNLSGSPYVLIPRLLYISSKRPSPPRIDELAASVQSLSSGKKAPTFVVAMGNDDLHVRARIDLVDWLGQKEAAPAPNPAPAKK